jgi:uncharacterized protein (TIGR00369 family)
MSGRKKIRNPFDADKNQCFGCSITNPAGLKLTFEEEDGKLYASWDPLPHFQGYINVLHGGIIATLLDEVGAWCIYITAGTSGVTSSLTVRYLKPVYITKGTVRIEAELILLKEKSGLYKCRLYDGEGRQCAEADIDYFLYPEKIARQRFHFPGKEAFYQE